jgi:hypothetical protein
MTDRKWVRWAGELEGSGESSPLVELEGVEGPNFVGEVYEGSMIWKQESSS